MRGGRRERGGDLLPLWLVMRVIELWRGREIVWICIVETQLGDL